MKKLIFFIIIALTGLTASAQISGQANKTCQYSDTTILKVFFTSNWDYNLTSKTYHGVFFYYMSKSSLRNGNPQITVDNLPREVTLDWSANQSSTYQQTISILRTAIKDAFILQNPTWIYTDIPLN